MHTIIASRYRNAFELLRRLAGTGHKTCKAKERESMHSWLILTQIMEIS